MYTNNTYDNHSSKNTNVRLAVRYCKCDSITNYMRKCKAYSDRYHLKRPIKLLMSTLGPSDKLPQLSIPYSTSVPTTASTPSAKSTSAQETPTAEESPDHQFEYDRHFCKWLRDNKCSILVTSYSQLKLYSIGTKDSGELSIYFTNMPRPMGVCSGGSSLHIATLGNIITYENKGVETDEKWGRFDACYYPQHVYLAGDYDCHDLRINDAGEMWFISTTYNCVCQPSVKNSFDVYYVPPWITKNDKGLPPGEDRCHLNGLCLVDGKPRYVTASCMKDYHSAWRDHMIKGGVAYDIVDGVVVADGLTCPHSPQMYRGKLWLLEAGTGEFGYVDLQVRKFVPKKFLPGFLRGLSFVGKYAVICLSADRHDSSFNDIPLGKILKERDQKMKIGVFIIDMDTFDIKHSLQFQNNKMEFYDAMVLQNYTRPRVYDINDDKLMSTFHLGLSSK